jgi:hypothetical protein
MLTYKIHVGEPQRDYRGGDLLNAIDEVICYFQRNVELDENHVADILELYAKQVRGE